MSPYAELQHQMGELEHAFVKKYGARTGFRIQRGIRVNGFYNGQRRHIGWYKWTGLKRDLRALLTALSHDATFHEDLQFFLHIARGDVARDQQFEKEITALVDEINLGR